MDVDLLLQVVGWLTCLFWLVLLGPGCVLLNWRTLGRISDRTASPSHWPRVSIIVPARNEGVKVAASLRSLLTIDYPHYEIIAVNDRSNDDTGEWMDRVARESVGTNRLQVLHLNQLPDGWLGKNHALHVAAARAEGEWLLFTDGDVLFEGDVLKRAVRVAMNRRLGLLSLLPKMISASFAETALVTYFGFLCVVGVPLWLVPTRVRLAYMGVGAFNLVRRADYQAAGGHGPIGMDVLDDVKLAKLMKHSGCRIDILPAGSGVRVRWQDSAWGVITGLEKNGFGAVRYSWTLLILHTLLFGLTMFWPYAASVLLPWPENAGYLATLAVLHIGMAFCAWGYGETPLVSVALPLSAAGLIFAFWRSAVLITRTGGVRWRDTLYPLAILKRRMY